MVVVVVVMRGGGSGFQLMFLKETGFHSQQKRQCAYNNAQRRKRTLRQRSKSPSITTASHSSKYKGDKLNQDRPLPSPSYRWFYWIMETVLRFRTRLHLTHIRSRQLRWATGRHGQLLHQTSTRHQHQKTARHQHQRPTRHQNRKTARHRSKELHHPGVSSLQWTVSWRSTW